MQYKPNDYNTLRFVDQVGKNYLFRGGAPTQPVPDPDNPGNCKPEPNDPNTCLQVFDYEGLTKAIASAPNLPCVPPPPASEYYLVIIDLVHSSEVDEFEPAMNYFNDPQHADRKNRGQVNLWDTNGTDICYFNPPPGSDPEQLIATIEEWLGDPLVWRVATIRSWLEHPKRIPSGPWKPTGPEGGPIDGGCDRTGEMIGAYRLRYMNEAWSAVWGDQPCQRPMGCDNYRALQWYAFWLNQTQGFNLQHIGVDGGCTDYHILHRICSAPDGGYLP